jgi:hypothetical protein
MSRRLFPGVVTMKYRGRLGNHLAQYCVARRIASELRFDLRCPPIAGFPNAVSLGPALRRYLPLQPKQVVRTHHALDLASVLSDRQPRIIDLNGLFLRYEYFAPCKQVIRDSWLWSGPLTQAEPDVLAIHIRSGDVWTSDDGNREGTKTGITQYHTLPFSYYARIIEERRWRRIDVVTEDPGDPMVEKLERSFGVKVISGSVISDFNHLRRSRNIVLSVSSFAWWAAWLSDAERIYYPLLGLFDSERAKGRPAAWQQDLQVIDEPRYTFIEVSAPSGDWTGSPEDRVRLLNS